MRPASATAARKTPKSKQGQRPKDFDASLRRSCQKDTDARWAKKNDQTHYGYKNHVKVDGASKIIETFTVTHAAVHDSQPVRELLTESDREKAIYADSAYTGQPVATLLESVGAIVGICEKGTVGRPLTATQKANNCSKSSVRARVEHVFGRIAQLGGDRYRRIGLARCRFETALTNLTFNCDRYAFLRS